MKQAIRFNKTWYILIILFFSMSHSNIQAYDIVQTVCLKQNDDQDFLNIFTSFKIIKNLKNNMYDDESNLYFIDEIIEILGEMYEKIVGATVTYYVCIYLPIQVNLHEQISQIIAKDFMRIITVLRKQCIRFINTSEITWQRKIQYCLGAISVIFFIKFAVDYFIKREIIPDQIPSIMFDINQNHISKSVYLKDKFDN